MSISFKFLLVLLRFLPNQIRARSLSPQFAAYESLDGTIVIRRSTGILGMFGLFTVRLNEKVLGMLEVEKEKS